MYSCTVRYEYSTFIVSLYVSNLHYVTKKYGTVQYITTSRDDDARMRRSRSLRVRVRVRV